MIFLIFLTKAQKDKGASETEELKKSNKDITDKLRSSEQILQEKEMRLTVLKTQFDSKITRLERELQEAKDKVQSLTENNQKLEQNLK